MIEFEALELYGQRAEEERDEEQKRDEQHRKAREMVDVGRLALAELVGPAVGVIACRLMGQTTDPHGRAVDADREKVAWEVLSRVGVPKLRATAVAASLSASPSMPAPIYGAYGRIEDGAELGSADEAELDSGSVDAQIDAFMRGAAAARVLRDEE